MTSQSHESHLRDRIDGLPNRETYELRRLIWMGKPSASFRPTMMRRLVLKGLAREVIHPVFEPTDKGRSVADANLYREAA